MKTGGRFVSLMIVAVFAVASLYLWFVTTPYFESLIAWADQNRLLFFIVLLLLKITGIVFPPIPGGTLTLGAVPAIGWQSAYLVDFAGALIGAIVAYTLGKKYGYPLLTKLFDEQIIEKIRTTGIKKGKEIEAMFVFRIVGSGLLTEAVYYAAGLLNMRAKSFLIGFVLTHLTLTLPAFMVAEVVLSKQNLLLNLLFVLVALPLMWKIKGRYLE